jgi:hypothetical protein
VARATLVHLDLELLAASFKVTGSSDAEDDWSPRFEMAHR